MSRASFSYLKTMPRAFNIFINELGDGTEYNKSLLFPAVSMHRMRGSEHAGIRKDPLNFWIVNVISEQLG